MYVAKSPFSEIQDLLPKSTKNKYKDDLIKLKTILRLEREKTMSDDTTDLKLVALDKLEELEKHEESLKNTKTQLPKKHK